MIAFRTQTEYTGINNRYGAEETGMENILHPELYYFVRKECTPAWKIEKQMIQFYCLVFIQEGGAAYRIDDKQYEVCAGKVVFIRPGSTRQASTGGMRCTALDFTLPEGEDITMEPISDRSDFEEFERIFREIQFEWLQKRDGYQLKCQALFALVLHRLLYEKDSGTRNSRIEAVKRYILEHYCEELPVGRLAEEAGLSPVYCGALFRRTEGITIAEFINRVRMNKAASLLATGEYTVGEVAEKVGFKDIYYFSNTFKRFMGTSPGSYKKL